MCRHIVYIYQCCGREEDGLLDECSDFNTRYCILVSRAPTPRDGPCRACLNNQIYGQPEPDHQGSDTNLEDGGLCHWFCVHCSSGGSPTLAPRRLPSSSRSQTLPSVTSDLLHPPLAHIPDESSRDPIVIEELWALPFQLRDAVCENLTTTTNNTSEIPSHLVKPDQTELGEASSSAAARQLSPSQPTAPSTSKSDTRGQVERKHSIRTESLSTADSEQSQLSAQAMVQLQERQREALRVGLINGRRRQPPLSIVIPSPEDWSRFQIPNWDRPRSNQAFDERPLSPLSVGSGEDSPDSCGWHGRMPSPNSVIESDEESDIEEMILRENWEDVLKYIQRNLGDESPNEYRNWN